jgi:hypothetical protein
MKLGFDEVTAHPSYDKAATQVSKTYITLFFAFCAVVAFIDSPTLGWWWAAVLIGGLFASSILIAAPVTALKIALGTKVGVSPLSLFGRIFYLAYDLAGYVLLWFVTRYAINALST